MQRKIITADDIILNRHKELLQKSSNGKVHRQHKKLFSFLFLAIILISTCAVFFFTKETVPNSSDDSSDHLIITEAVNRNHKKIIIKEVKLWNGGRSAVDGKFERTGKIVDAERSSCSKTTKMEIMNLILKNSVGEKICFSLTPITKPIQNKMMKEMLKNELLKEEYKDKTITITGYGWDNSSPEHNLGKSQEETKKIHMQHEDTYIKCSEHLRIFVSDLDIKS